MRMLFFCYLAVVYCCPQSYEFVVASGDIHPFSVGHYQMKLDSFYLHNDRPPYKEAFFITRLPTNESEALLESCPAIWILSRAVVFEHDAFVRPVADAYHELIEPSLYIFENMDSLRRVWPLDEAIRKARETFLKLGEAQGSEIGQSSVSFIVCHCREPLEWLSDRNMSHIPLRSSLYIYEKCGRDSGPDLVSVQERFESGVFIVDRPDGPVRGDECSGFLSYLVEHYDNLADYTILLQSDPDHHLFFSYLDSILRGITLGTYNSQFLHLNYHRHVQTTTPCMRDVESFLFQLNRESIEQKGLLGTYCCAQFVVHKERVQANSPQFYDHMLAMVDGRYPDLCVNGQPKRSSQCYVFEFLWHVVFGEPRDLPLRPDDNRLPNALRMKYGNEHVRTWWADLDMAPGSRRPLKPTTAIV